MKLTFINEIARYYRDLFEEYGIEIEIENTEKFVKWLVQYSDLIKEYKEFYKDVNFDVDFLLDTATRDLLRDIIANAFGFLSWPVNMDESSYKEKFARKLINLKNPELEHVGIEIRNESKNEETPKLYMYLGEKAEELQ